MDLQAGSQFGYRLLFVVLLAGLFAVFLQVGPHNYVVFAGGLISTAQVLASRLGCVTGIGEHDVPTSMSLVAFDVDSVYARSSLHCYHVGVETCTVHVSSRLDFHISMCPSPVPTHQS